MSIDLDKKSTKQAARKLRLQKLVGQRLVGFLAEKNTTIAGVAETMGKHPSYLYRIKNGTENPTVEQLHILVTACNSNLAEFFNSGWDRKTA